MESGPKQWMILGQGQLFFTTYMQKYRTELETQS